MPGQRLGGTDGYRDEVELDTTDPGRVNQYTFAHLACAYMAIHQGLQGDRGTAFVCRDPRPSGDPLLRAVIAGVTARGARVRYLGEAATPIGQKYAYHHRGIAFVVTASHNKKKYNGLKSMPLGEKPLDDIVQRASDQFWVQTDSGIAIPIDGPNDAIERPESHDWYMKTLLSDIEARFGPQPLKGKRFVVDGGNGAGGGTTPKALKHLGAVVDTFCCDTSDDINEGCGATDLSGLKTFLNDHPDIRDHSDFVGAVAHDGDADRMVALGLAPDMYGQMQFVEINGNHIMWMQAQGQPGIVGTEYTNSGLRRALQQQNIGFVECKNGDTHVTAMLRKLGLTRGGEASGHNVDLEWLPSGDGIRNALWLACWAAENNMTFGDIHRALLLWPEAKINMPLPEAMAGIMEDRVVADAVQKVRSWLGGEGRLIVRLSGTEGFLLRLWAESSKDQRTANLAVESVQRVVRERAGLVPAYSVPVIHP